MRHPLRRISGETHSNTTPNETSDMPFLTSKGVQDTYNDKHMYRTPAAWDNGPKSLLESAGSIGTYSILCCLNRVRYGPSCLPPKNVSFEKCDPVVPSRLMLDPGYSGYTTPPAGRRDQQTAWVTCSHGWLELRQPLLAPTACWA